MDWDCRNTVRFVGSRVRLCLTFPGQLSCTWAASKADADPFSLTAVLFLTCEVIQTNKSHLSTPCCDCTYGFWELALPLMGKLGSRSLPCITHTLLATAFPLLIESCAASCSAGPVISISDPLLCSLLFQLCGNMERTTKKQSFLCYHRAQCWLQTRLPFQDGLLKQCASEGSKHPLNMPLGTTAHHFLILLEQRFPDSSYHTQRILRMFAKWSQVQIWFDVSCKDPLSSKFGRRKRQLFLTKWFPSPPVKFLHWETFASQSLFFLSTELTPYKNSSPAGLDRG